MPPAIAKTSATKTSTKSVTTTQTEPEPPTPARETAHEDHAQETEIELPAPVPKAPIVAGWCGANIETNKWDYWDLMYMTHKILHGTR